MKVKLILPALTEAVSPYFRPIKYSLFPPLGLATLAAYLDPEDEISLQDEHVEIPDLDDEPDLVVIQVYITSAFRAYRIADHYRRKGARVVLGGLAVVPTPATSATRRPSSKAARASTPRPSTRPSRRSTACPGATSTSSTTTSSATRASRRRSSKACAGWGDFGRRRARLLRCCGPIFSRRPWPRASGACSSGSRP